ncbi:MAG: pseudouridine synthase [Desulfobacteraceae bacterium 4572_130]|nr:MAG: pseudouridine synthase [Desulfobacteraceae bacterium 4572_130]
MRLQKFLSMSGVCSRRKGEEYIVKGRISVNNKIITSLGTKIHSEKDYIAFNNKRIFFSPNKENIYIILNKPLGYVTSCSHKGEKTVLDLVNIKKRVYPAGRLDKNSKGLILLINDGDLHNKLLHPSYNHEKEYIIETFNPVGDHDLDKMAQGIMLDNKKTRRARVKRISQYSFNIILKQGINRQIRRMVQKIGNRVKVLKRIRIGSIKLSNLKEGKWRYLNSNEIKTFKIESSN